MKSPPPSLDTRNRSQRYALSVSSCDMILTYVIISLIQLRLYALSPLVMVMMANDHVFVLMRSSAKKEVILNPKHVACEISYTNERHMNNRICEVGFIWGS